MDIILLSLPHVQFFMDEVRCDVLSQEQHSYKTSMKMRDINYTNWLNILCLPMVSIIVLWTSLLLTSDVLRN